MDPASVKEEQAAGPKRCSNLCGFFANPNCGDMCSKCSREVQASQAQAVKAIAATAPAPPPQPLVQQQQLLARQQQQQQCAQQQDATAPLPATAHTESALVAATDRESQQIFTASAAAAADSFSSPSVAISIATPAQHSGPEASIDGTSVPANPSSAAIGEDDGVAEAPRRVQKHTNRCFSCSKKVGLTGFKCRCGYVFCGPHRLAEAHACDYDYRATGRAHLAKANPLIQADRVQRF